MLQASFHAKHPWVGVGWNKMDKMWIVVDAGGWAHGVYYTALFLWMWIFFPHKELKKKSQDVLLSLGSSPWRAVTVDSTGFSPGSCTHVDEEGWEARAVQGCVSFPGLLYSILQTWGLKTTEIYSLEILKAYKSQLEVSAASLWATKGGSFLASSSWQSLGFLAARLHPSNLCLCYHVAFSLPLFVWSSLCVSVSSSIFPTP